MAKTSTPPRRRFMLNLATLPMLVLGPIVLDACRAKNEEQSPANIAPEVSDCQDLSNVGEEDLAIRQKLAYVDESPIADNHCGNCNLFLPPAAEGRCGGCMLFKGPVLPTGYCTYWAPRV